jgi:hypothetical protein
MMRTLTLLPLTFLALLMMAAPAAMAQEANETPSEPTEGGEAWTKDCPPDAYCMYGAGGGSSPGCADASNNTTSDCPTYKGDCGGEVCALDGGAPQGECMTGRAGCSMEDCPNCRTLTGGGAPDDAAADAGAPAGAESDAVKNTVPGAALVGTLAALGVAGLALRRR